MRPNRALLILASALLLAAPATAWKVDPALVAACPALGKAITMANQIVNSSEGVDCFVNGPLDKGMDPEMFDDDGEGPEITVENLPDCVYGIYRSATAPNTIVVDEQLKIDAETNPAILMVLAATIVHETTHWVDHTADAGHDTPGEEGCAMETWIFGFPKWIENAMGTALCQVSAQDALVLSLAATRPSYVVGEPIEVQLSFTNRTANALSFIDLLELPAGFLSFTVRTPSGRLSLYQGGEGKAWPREQNVVTLQPGQSTARTVRLNAPGDGYPMASAGTYQVSAQFMQPNFGCPMFGRSDYFIGTAKSGTLALSVAKPVAVDPVDHRGDERMDN